MNLLEVVGVDVFPPPHTTYLIRNSFTNTQNTCFILVKVLVLHTPPCPDLWTKSDLTVHTPDVVENIIGYTVLVVLEDGHHVGCLEVSFFFCSCEECRTTGSGCAYVGYSLDEEGLSVVRTLQPVDSLDVFIGIPIRGPVGMLEVEAIGDDVAWGCPLRRLVAQPQTTKVFEWSLRCLCHLDGDEGDDLLGKTVPSATGIHPLRRLHGDALWESGREVNTSMNEIGYPSQVFMCI
jgi:hypothetical protein